MSTTKLLIDQVTHERQDRVLLNAVHIGLQAGQALQIRGANGSGKSTLLRILAGYMRPQAGRILWQDVCIHTALSTYQNRLHYIGHVNGLKPALTVTENCHLYLKLADAPLTPLAPVLAMLCLTRYSDTPVKELSAGLARRAALAKLLLQTKPLWILDEPLTSLDTEGQAVFHDILQKHIQQNGMAILATHHTIEINALQSLTLGETHAA